MPANDEVMVALSGGLDSVDLMHDLIDKGYKVTALHVSGLNKSSGQYEARRAGEIAKAAKVKYIKANFHSPRQAFPDNPFKNQLVLGIMLDLGVKRGIYRYAVGSDWETPLNQATAGYTVTDSIEVNREYWKGVKSHFPQAELIFIDSDIKKQQRIEYLYRKNVLPLVTSCVQPLRFRDHLHKVNIERYGVDLMPGRCGSCFKCAMEWLLLADAGLIEHDAAYELHCWDVLATAKTSHRPELFGKHLPIEERLINLREYGS